MKFLQMQKIINGRRCPTYKIPIIALKKENKLDLFETSMLNITFNFDFLGYLMTMPKLVRNIAVAGSLQHGKTSFRDNLYIIHIIIQIFLNI